MASQSSVSELPGEVGLIGIGLLGSAIAERLLRFGIPVRGFDLSEDRNAWFAGQGGTVAGSASEIFQTNSRIILSLPTSRHVAELMTRFPFSKSAGTLILDTTTGSPRDAAELGASLAASGIEYLDATILGSSADLRQGDALLMAGGTSAGFLQAHPIAEKISKKSFHVGDWGSGSRMKLVVNLVLGLHRAVLAEGLTFANRLGFDRNLALEILSSGIAASEVMRTKGPRMISGEFTPQARLAQHHKDVTLILQEGKLAHQELPLSSLHEQLLRQCIDAGWGDLDNSSIIQLWEQLRP